MVGEPYQGICESAEEFWLIYRAYSDLIKMCIANARVVAGALCCTVLEI